MEFTPTGQITLCKVPFDKSYKNVVYFENRTAQSEWFDSNAVLPISHFRDYLYVRRVKEDGTLKSSIKVNSNIDGLYDFNYLYYYNGDRNYASYYKRFYCFITDLIYINEGTTEIVFETDVYQTWMLDCEILDSFVEREHGLYENEKEAFPSLTNEPFNVNDFVYEEITPINTDYPTFDYGYLLITTEQIYETDVFGLQSGIYQGLCYYFHTDVNSLWVELHNLDKELVVSIVPIPKFMIREKRIYLKGDVEPHTYYDLDDVSTAGQIGDNFMKHINVDVLYGIYHEAGASAYGEGFRFYVPHENYNSPKNKKVYAPQFYSLVVTNNAGEVAEYDLSQFAQQGVATFRLYGDISTSPTVSLIPNNYKNLNNFVDEGISLGGFPQCSYASDAYKLWLAKNQFTLGKQTAMSGIGVAFGAALMSNPATAIFGATSMLSGIQGITNVIDSEYQATKLPNLYTTGNPTNNILTAMGENRFRYYIKRLKCEHAKQLDDFFTMYGYQTNQVKKPNVSNRSCFNYVKTIDINIIGGIPNTDMTKLKKIYDNGVTLWKPNATVGDYSVNNY